MKSFLHCLLIELLEAFHRAVRHHQHSVHYLLLVFPQELQSQEKQESEVCEDIGILALHQLDVILSQLEGSLLEVHVSWTTRNHETKIDVDDMSLCIH